MPLRLSRPNQSRRVLLNALLFAIGILLTLVLLYYDRLL